MEGVWIKTEELERLHAELAAMTKERDDLIKGWKDATWQHNGDMDSMYKEIAASQAREVKLREALEQIAEEKARGYHEIRSIALDAITITSDDSALQERLRAAKVDVLREAANRTYNEDDVAMINSMADEIERGERE